MRFQSNRPGTCIHAQPLTFFDARHSGRDICHRRQAIFTGDNRAVRQRPAHLHDQPSSDPKNRRHAWVDYRGDENIAGFETAPVCRRSHQASRAGHDSDAIGRPRKRS